MISTPSKPTAAAASSLSGSVPLSATVAIAFAQRAGGGG